MMNMAKAISYELSATVGRHKEQLLLGVGDVWRVPDSVQSVRVLAGTAWLSCEGIDTVLFVGDQYSVNASQDVAVVSAMNRMSLLLELIRT